MAVLAQQSVGDTLYQLVDARPTHTASRGSVAIDSTSNIIYTNLDGSSGWGVLTIPTYGTIYYEGNTTATNPAAGTWVNDNATPSTGWTSGQMRGMTLSNGTMVVDAGESPGRYLISSASTVISASARNYVIELFPAVNNLVSATPTQQSTSSNNVSTALSASRCDTLRAGDYVNFGKRWITNSGGGAQNGFIVQNNMLHAEKISDIPRNVLFSTGFETGDLSEFTVVNGAQTNQWVAGTSIVSSGTYAAYISNNGTAAQYTNTAASVTHIYRDITFPAGSEFEIKFTWQCVGENGAGADQYDYGRVFVAPTSVTPVAGTQVSSTHRVGLTKYNQQASFVDEYIQLGSAYSGQTWRIIFSWANDATVGTNPPFVIDNIEVAALF